MPKLQTQEHTPGQLTAVDSPLSQFGIGNIFELPVAGELTLAEATQAIEQLHRETALAAAAHRQMFGETDPTLASTGGTYQLETPARPAPTTPRKSITRQEVVDLFARDNANTEATLKDSTQTGVPWAADFPLVDTNNVQVGTLTAIDVNIEPQIATNFGAEPLVGITVDEDQAGHLKLGAKLAGVMLINAMLSPIKTHTELHIPDASPLLKRTVDSINRSSTAGVIGAMTGASDGVPWAAAEAEEIGSITGALQQVKVHTRETLDDLQWLAQLKPGWVSDRQDRHKLLETGAKIHREGISTLIDMFDTCGHKLSSETIKNLTILSKHYVIPPTQFPTLSFVDQLTQP
jgi:hypothetical protein